MKISEKTIKGVYERINAVSSDIGLLKQYAIPNYHSNLEPGEYHFLTGSIQLALSIFTAEIKEYYPLANSMLRKVISCQCRDGECAGLWPYYYEESLEEMVEPDWNYADFNSYPMVIIMKKCADKLEDGMYEELKEACIYACKAIIKRNLTVLYTNPTAMGIFVMFACGEMFDRADLIEFGRKKLKKYFYLTMKDETYTEYNCPGYTLLILEIYSLILQHVKDSEVIEKVTILNDIAWKMMGEHYHNPTGEFTGPKIRAYTNFISEDQKRVYQNAIGSELGLLPPEKKELSVMDLVYNVKCPDYLKNYFTNCNKETEFRRIMTYGYNYPHFGFAQVDTQYIKPKFTLGSINCMDAWNQRHNVVSYIGNHDKKVCIRMRVYHDGYDYQSAFMTTAQEKGTAMTVVNFVTNMGDSHANLDPVVDAKIKAKDLRVRYQIEANAEGVIDEVNITEKECGCLFEAFGVPGEVKYHYAEMSGENPYFEIVREDNSIFIDMVLYHGEEKTINFKELKALTVVSHLSVNQSTDGSPEITKDNEFIYAKWNINGLDAEIKASFIPQEQIPSVLGDEVKFNGSHIMKYTEENYY